MRFLAVVRLLALAGRPAASACALGVLAVVSLGSAGCAPAMTAAPVDAPGGGLRGRNGGGDQGLRLAPDPTVNGARLVPLGLRDDRAFGTEPGGGVRGIAAGVRVLSLPGGAVVAADDRFPVAPSSVVALPDRLGGGFLFVVGEATVWRADRWLGVARPVFVSSSPIARVVPGLDRVYVRAQSGAWRAIDGKTGEGAPLGPWPASPTVAGYAAADGWRALAIADLRGPVATFDAGATWQPVRVPIDPRSVEVAGESLVISERERGGITYEVRPDGKVLRAPDAARGSGGLVESVASAEPTGPLGARPLQAVIEDGWPLDDGTALVARDGALARVRLDDGAIVDLAPGAYAMRPSRCHPVPLGVSGGAGQLGFVCGEPRGATVIYALDPVHGKLAEVRRWAGPRAVLASGNGALAVHGGCDAGSVSSDARDGRAATGGSGASEAGDARTITRAYCVRSREGAWREIHVEGTNGGERVVVLTDGRFAILSPPQGDLGAARLTVLDGDRTRTVPIAFASIAADVRRVLDVGVWLDGFEERRPGVLGGWIEAAGTMLGVEIALDGAAHVGPFVRDAGLPMVSGRYGLGWTASRQGFETTDGGMTWTPIDVPEPIAPTRLVASRACGPIGCSAAGWLRVGWGKPRAEPPPPAPPAQVPAPRTYVSLPLECELAEGARGAKAAATSPAPPRAVTGDDRVISYDASDTVDRSVRFGALARVSAWGPKTGEWDHAAKWQARWTWPFGGASDTASSVPAPAPAPLVEVARLGNAMTAMTQVYSLGTGDDAAHALIVGRRQGRLETTVYEVESDRAPIELHRADGEPFTELDAAMRAGGRWYLATPPRGGEHTETTLWQVDGGIARELARVPRTTAATRPLTSRLAWRTDGRALGLVVDGQPTAERAGATRWVIAIDPETGALGNVEPLGASDLGDRATLSACTGDESGWQIDLPVTFPIGLSSSGEPLGSLHGSLARMVVTRSRSCVSRIAGALDAVPEERALHRGPLPPGASISVAVVAGRERRALRCVVR